MSIYPTVRPSLTLDFRKSKQLDPRITFSRSSSATYVEGGVVKYADEHQARFEEEGLLIEESRTNYIDESVDLTDTGTWANYKFETPTLNAGTAPDGTNTAASLIPNTENVNRSYWCKNISTTFSGTLTVSVFAKANGYSTFRLGIDSSSTGGSFGGSAVFDLSAGTATPGTAGTGKIQSLSNGWYKCSVTHTNTAQAFGITPYVGGIDNNGDTVFTGDGTSGYLLWGFQLEEGFLTSYIPTDGSESIRAADFMEVEAARLNQFWRRNLWTAVWEFKGNNSYYGFQISNGTHRGDRSWIGTIPDKSPTQIEIGGRGVLRGPGPVWSEDTNYKIAVGIDTDFTTGIGNGSYAVNGELMVTNNIATQTNRQLEEVRFYYNNIGDEKLLNGHYSRAVLYPELLTEAQMEAITS